MARLKNIPLSSEHGTRTNGVGIYQMREPDFIIGDKSRPYMLRWWLIPRNPWFNVYLHKIMRDDDDRALHDHPWASLSVVIQGGYREIRPTGQRIVKPGGIVFRPATFAHRLELLNGQHCWSLFFTGPRVRSWGFHCPKGWVHWKVFTNPLDYGQVGRGCD